jgi:hypothetical protein
MGSNRAESKKPDLLSMTSDGKPLSALSSTTSHTPPFAVSSPRYVLPKDLPSAIKQIDDQELDRLLAAVLAEQKRRGGKSCAANQPSQKNRVEPAGLRLTTGKLNAVRAAFGAGIKPTQIARQFGLSDADVRKALASGEKKR